MSEALRKETAANATEAAEWIARARLNFLKGGPDLEALCVERAKRDGLSVDVVHEGWADVKAKRAGAEAIEPAPELRGIAALRKLRDLKIGTPAKTKAQPEPEPAAAGDAEALAAELARAAAEKVRQFDPEPEPPKLEAEQTKALPVPVGFFSSSDEVLCLIRTAPFDNALKLISSRAWHRAEGIRTLNYWQRSFWDWTSTRWREADDEEVRASLWAHLNAAERFGKDEEGRRERFRPKSADVSSTLDALRGASNLPWSDGQNAMPGWFGRGQPDGDLRELVACQNGILHIPTRTLVPHTPRFWSPNVLDFAYDPEARAPRFEQFLREIWPGDPEAQQCLLEMLGLCLTDITKYQKAFMLVGPPRGGRGTIGRVMKALIGPSNYVGTSLRAFSEPFGMESFIGKKVVVFSDARLDGVPQRNLSAITERLLTITGEDDADVNRKNAKYWKGKLTARIIIFTNELLRIQDQSGALPRRMLVFRMQESFMGKEDTNLSNKLIAECPGILNLALAALDQVRARDGLIQCKSGQNMAESLQKLSSDVSVFVEEVCVVGPEHEILCRDLFHRWQSWCEERGVRHNWGENQFSAKLRAVLPRITDSRPRETPTRLTKLYGVAIRKAEAQPKRKLPTLEEFHARRKLALVNVEA